MSFKKEYAEMLSSAVKYLTDNTDITYFGNGSIAKALLETNLLEIERLQNYFEQISKNSFVGTAAGFYLDLWGEVLGIPRITDKKAFAFAQDSVVRFYVDNGTLGSRLPHPTNPSLGLIPQGIVISNSADNIGFIVSEDTTFPRNSKTASVSVIAIESGTEFNVGANQLTRHTLPNKEVKVTNPIAITSGADIESDSDYRFRLSQALSTRFGSNKAAVDVASTTSPAVAYSKIIPYNRGAGTFDVVLVPRGNKLTKAAINQTNYALNQVVSYGISYKIKEPEYVPIRLSVQLSFTRGIGEGEKEAARNSAQAAILDYLSTIPLGGELVINQIRAAVLNSNSVIKDLKIIELYIDCKPRTLRNVQLREDELFIPDENVVDPIEVV